LTTEIAEKNVEANLIFIMSDREGRICIYYSAFYELPHII